MPDNLIHHTNMNNKRLSKLQRVILTVLAEEPSESEPRTRNEVALEVAGRYGNGSLTDIHQRTETFYERQAQNYERHKLKNPEAANKMLELSAQINEYVVSCYRKHEWLTNKYSVSWSRSLRNLREQGLIEYSRPWGCVGYFAIAVAITDKGRELLATR